MSDLHLCIHTSQSERSIASAKVTPTTYPACEDESRFRDVPTQQ